MKQIRKLLILTIFFTVSSFQTEDSETLIYINIKVGLDVVKDLTKTQVKLIYKKEPELTIKLNNNMLTIKPFLDSAKLHINYNAQEIETPLLSYSEFKNISSLDIHILTAKEIEQKYRNDSLYKNVVSVYTISEKQKTHEVGFFIEYIKKAYGGCRHY